MGAASSHLSNQQLCEQLEAGSVEAFLDAVSANRKFAKRPLRSRNGDTGIHILASKNHAQALQTVLQAIIQAYATERGGSLTPEQRSKCTAKACNVLNDRGRTPLMVAAKHGHMNAISVLLAHEANIWARDQEGGAVVTHYAAAGGHVEVIKLLAQHALTHPPPSYMEGKTITDIANANGLTPLHYAVWHKRHQAVTALCQLGASLYAASTCSTCGDEAPCPAGSTPLHFVAVSGSLRSSKALMRAYLARLATHEEAVREGRATEDDAPIDPRVLADVKGDLPCTVASRRDNTRLLTFLHPLVALDEMFADERPEDRLVGVPRLTEMCSMIAQRMLLQQLEQLQVAPAAPAAAPAGSSTPARPTAAPNSSTPDRTTSTTPATATADSNGNTEPTQPSSNAAPAMAASHEPVQTASATDTPAVSTSSPAPQQTQPPQPPSHVPEERSLYAALIQQETDMSDVAARDSSGDELGMPQHRQPGAQCPVVSSQQAGISAAASATSTTTAAVAVANGTLSPAAVRSPRQGTDGPGAPGSTDLHAYVPASTLDSLNLILAHKAESNQQSWIERRGAWRSKLPPLPRLKAAGNRPDVRLPKANGDTAAPGGGLLPGSQATASPWMSRRSAWRATLKRHEQQLLEGASAATMALHKGQGHFKSHFASTQNLAELRSLLASQQPGDMVASPHAHDHHIPPGAALCLRLLGGVSASEAAHTDGSAAAQAAMLAGVLGGSGPGGPSRTQIDAAIQMVRMHRLRNGVNDLLGGGIEPIYESVYDTGCPAESDNHPCTPRTNGDQPLAYRNSRELLHGLHQAQEASGMLLLRSPSPKPAMLDPYQLPGNSPAALPDASGARSLFASVGRLSFNRLPGSKAPSLSGKASSMCDEDMCGVCLEGGTMITIKNCSHAICLSCARELVRLHDLKPSLCPFCRSLIMGFGPQVPTTRT